MCVGALGLRRSGEHGADDVAGDPESREYEVRCEPEAFDDVRKGFEEKGIKISSGEVAMVPQTTVHLEGKPAETMLKMMNALEESDDVQNVWANFDISDEAAMESYRHMYRAYSRIFARCGLQAFPVEADTGVIGGNYSHEFMVPADTGENEVVFCEACGYAANIEKATSGIPATAARSHDPYTV